MGPGSSPGFISALSTTVYLFGTTPLMLSQARAQQPHVSEAAGVMLHVSEAAKCPAKCPTRRRAHGLGAAHGPGLSTKNVRPSLKPVWRALDNRIDTAVATRVLVASALATLTVCRDDPQSVAVAAAVVR